MQSTHIPSIYHFILNVPFPKLPILSLSLINYINNDKCPPRSEKGKNDPKIVSIMRQKYPYKLEEKKKTKINHFLKSNKKKTSEKIKMTPLVFQFFGLAFHFHFFFFFFFAIIFIF
jgi:hypothetical protein